MGRPIKNLASLFLILFLSFLMLSRLAYSLTQKTFVLNPDSLIFKYEQYALNNTNTSENLVFNGSQNITRYITIPKNSTILNSNITMLGQITPSQSTGSGIAYLCVAIGNVTGGSKEDIVIGAITTPHVTLFNSTINAQWDFNASSQINSIAIGNILDQSNSEVVVGSSDANVYILNSSGIQNCSFNFGSTVNSVSIGNISTDPLNEIVIGGGTKVTVINSTCQQKWTSNIGASVYSVSIGEINLSSNENEVVAGIEDTIYIYNSTGTSTSTIVIGDIIKVITIDDITSDSGNEIVAGLNNGTVVVVTPDGTVKWSYNIGSVIYSISIGDTTSNSGNEIAVGGADNKIYQLGSDGSFIWSYTTGDDVRGVAIGDITSNSLNETVGVSVDQNVYILNFNNYPTNTSIDIGEDGDYDWTSPNEKMRTYNNATNSSIGQGIQDFLDSCDTQLCNVTFVFHSDAAGNLNITSINITYNYNASEAISIQNTSNLWSRLNDTNVNSTLGYQVRNITYHRNPANSITVNYVGIDSAATTCDFGGSSYSTATSEGVNVCDVTNFQVSSTGSLPSIHRLWDSSMTTDIPHFLNSTVGAVNASGIWIRNMTIYTNASNEPETFYNVTANLTIDENYVTSDELLLVDWYDNGTYYDITPSSPTSNCDSSSPTYTQKTVGSDNFYVCKEDINSNGVYEFFKWKQPHTSKRNYKIEGSSNYPLDLSDQQANSTSSIWGSAFNFSVYIGDFEEENATVSLLIYLSRNSSWERIETKNMTTNGTVWFVATSNRNWTGTNQYKFEYRDYNKTTGDVFHLWQNSSASEFNVTKHNIGIADIDIIGNNNEVNRTGTNTTTLIARINNTSNNSYVEDDVNCSFWITNDTSTFILSNQTSTNSTGYCVFTFDPNSTYNPGSQSWVVGVNNDVFYNSTNSSEYDVRIYAPLNVSFHSSSINRNVTRGIAYITAGIYDENNNLIPDPARQSICTFYLNNSQVYTESINSTGYCSYTWSTTCSDTIGVYPTNVTITDTPNEYYYIINNKANTTTTLKDALNIVIILPTNKTIYHEQETVILNSSVNDSCGVPAQTYTLGWYFVKSDNCPASNPVTTGDNSTWQLAANCNPREQLIIANATGGLYESNQKNTTIFIYGWAEANVTSPIAGNTTNRTVGQSTYTDLVCQVKDNITTSGIENYPIKFYNDSTLIGTSLTNSSGYATYTWNITNAPEGNTTINCTIQENSSLYYNVSVNESRSWMIITEVDTQYPYFTGVHANSTTPYNDILIEANVTDWYGVSAVWANVTYPNSTNYTYQLSNVNSNILSGTWRATITNVSNQGAYNYIIYANDTSNQINSTTGWFDIYNQLYLWGNATNTDGKNISITFTFYRPGTNKTIEVINTSFTGGSYNFSVFKTNADLKVNVIDHEIMFRNVNITSSAIAQSNENATNITNPLIFDNVSVSDIQLQSTTKNKMVALAINNNLKFDNAIITLNFTRNLNDYFDLSKPALKIYKCSNWELDNRTGCVSSWTQLTTVLTSSANTVSANITNMSAYVVAEYCSSCGDDSGSGDTGGSSGGGGGGGGGSLATCGNGKCEATENVDNCPEDCGKAERPPFSVKTNLTDVQIDAGKSEIYMIWIKNTYNKEINTSIHFSGSIFHLLAIDENFVELDIDEEKMIPIYVTIPVNTDSGVYTGEIVINGMGYTQRIPVTITVPFPGTLYIDVVVESLTKKVNPNGTAIFHVLIYNLGFRKKVNVSIDYVSKELKTANIIYRENEERTIEASLPLLKNVHIPENATLGDYSYEVEIEFQGQKISSADTFQVVKPFWDTTRVRFALIIIIAISFVIVGYYIRKLYKDWKLSKLRYIYPVDPKTLPKGELWIGNIAETDQKTTLEMEELRTHVLTAGATGSGKSVSAMILAEELLEKKIPIVVFDPTAQWTGFVRPCKDPNLLKFYKKFGMNLRDVKPYKGMIYEVKDPKVKIDFKKYMNPGEITVFTLNKLKPGEYDQAVHSIISTIFQQGWEESPKLQLIIVFDEVHRLLEKYGGKGGYVSLERACREFRKWGIGLIMVSQVLSDFKEAIKGNVLTEIQLHTKSLGDLQRIEKKFGEDYAKKITRLEVGVGMVQNAKYNKGKPYFVSFRPTYHSPHKIPDEELDLYREYEKMLSEIESKINKLKSVKDVFGLNVELNLAKDKLKKGRFRMTKIYIDSLTKSLSREN